MDNRREFLKKAALLSGGFGVAGSLPASIQRALAINPVMGSTWEDAEHVVFLMQENRSFDHCFGTLQGVRGFNDPRAISLPNQNPVWLQTNANGDTYTPFHLDMKNTKATWMGGLPHSWTDQVDACNEGKYDQWLVAKQYGDKENKNFPMTMGYYTRNDLPFYYALADAFTVCDQHFCASLTGTTTNRSFFWTGKTRENAESRARVQNSDLYYNKEASWKTFPERLEENGIPWRVYQNEINIQTELDGEDENLLSNFSDNNLEWFSQYNVRFHKAHFDFLKKRIGELPSEINSLVASLARVNKNESQKISKKIKQKKEQLEKYNKEVVIWNPENFEKLSDREKNLHCRAFTTNYKDEDYHKTEWVTYDDNGTQRKIKIPKGDVLHQFREDVKTGKLPTVSWLVAPQYFSDHPSAPWFGAWYVSEVLDILTRNPEVWKKTIFVLNYDENDGYFDHVPPFVAPKPNSPQSGKVSGDIDTSSEYVFVNEELKRNSLEKKDARESPVGLGYRVPLVIASPWTRGGWVNSQVCDITSSLQFLEKYLSKKTGKEIKESNISDWRRMVSGDLTSAFRTYNGEKIKLPELVNRDLFFKEINNAQFKKTPTGFKALSREDLENVKMNPVTSPLLPQQEPGIRNSCSLPYQLKVDGKLSTDKKNFQMDFASGKELFGSQSAGAPFSVYAPGKYKVNEGDQKGTFENVKTWNYAVQAGKQVQSQWPLEDFENEQYHLRVYGPNGFFREFKGDKNDPGIFIELDYESLDKNPKKLSGNIICKLENKDGKDYTVEIKDKAYNHPMRTLVLGKSDIQKTEVIDLQKNFNWYDISIKIIGNKVYEKRYAGRIETGNHSKTDPYMGSVKF